MNATSLNKETLNNRRKILEDELADIKAALRLLNKLENQNNSINLETSKPNRLNINEHGEIDINELDIPKTKKSNKLTLHNRIQQTLPKFGTQEFTVNHMVAILNRLGIGSDAKHFKNRVSVIIKKLYESSEIDKTKEGVGSEPHFYRNIANQNTK